MTFIEYHENKEYRKLLPGIEESPKDRPYTNTRKLYRDISTGTAIFLNRMALISVISLHPSLLQTPGGTFRKLSSDAVFVVCSQTFTLFRFEEDGRASRNISIQFPCVCGYLSLL